LGNLPIVWPAKAVLLARPRGSALKKNENRFFAGLYYSANTGATPAKNHLKNTISKMKIVAQYAAVSVYKLHHVDKSI
jgi:hypothetical protein